MEVSKTFGAGSNPAAPANLTAARMAVACVCKWVQGPSAVMYGGIDVIAASLPVKESVRVRIPYVTPISSHD